MAKQKLFGNRNEPACETCALGKRGSDGQSVLCRRVGAVSLHHHCRHYQYDPLRRIPKRDPVLPSYDATDFWLDNLEDVIEPVAKSPVDNETVLRLREYLIHSNEPDVETILALLDCPAPEATEETVEETAEEIVEEATEEVIEEAAEEIVEEATEEVVEEAAEKVVQAVVEEPEAATPNVLPEIRFPTNSAVTPEEAAASLLEPVSAFEDEEPDEPIVSATVHPSGNVTLTPEEEALAAFRQEIAALESTLHSDAVAPITPRPGVTYIPVQPGVTYAPVPTAETAPAESEPSPYIPTDADRQVFAEIDRALSSKTASIADSSPDIEEDLERLDVQKADAFHAVFHDPALDLSMLTPEELQSEDTASHDPQFDDLARRLDATSTLSLSDEGFDDEFELNEKDIVLLSSAQLKDEAMEELALGADGKIRVVQPPPEKKKRK